MVEPKPELMQEYLYIKDDFMTGPCDIRALELIAVLNKQNIIILCEGFQELE